MAISPEELEKRLKTRRCNIGVMCSKCGQDHLELSPCHASNPAPVRRVRRYMPPARRRRISSAYIPVWAARKPITPPRVALPVSPALRGLGQLDRGSLGRVTVDPFIT